MRFESTDWSIDVPEGWIQEDDAECATFTPLNGVGALQISSYRKDAAVTDEDLFEFAGDVQLTPVSLGRLTGFCARFNEGNTFWTKWWLRAGHQLIHVTYNCSLADRGRENGDVANMIESIRADMAIRNNERDSRQVRLGQGGKQPPRCWVKLMKRFCTCSVCLIWTILLVGCVSKLLAPDHREPDALKPGDCLNIHYVRPNQDVREIVDAMGYISLPFHDKVLVGGLTLDRAQARIQHEYRQVESFSAVEVIVSRCK